MTLTASLSFRKSQTHQRVTIPTSLSLISVVLTTLDSANISLNGLGLANCNFPFKHKVIVPNQNDCLYKNPTPSSCYN